MELMEDGTTIEQQMFAMATEKKVPLYGVLELLPLCNLNCDMCYVRMSREEMEEVGRLRTMEEWTKTAEDMMKAGTLFVLLTGGEPLLYPHFRELYQKLRELGMIITINTNGTLIDEAWADFFAENKPRRINITLYGASNETYERLCHYPGGFDKAVNGIRLLRERNIDVKVNGSLAKANVDDRMKIIELGESLDAPVRIDTYMYPSVRERNHAYNNQARLDPEMAAKARVEVLQREMGEEVFAQYRKIQLDEAENTPEGEAVPGQMACRAGKSSFVVNWQGRCDPVWYWISQAYRFGMWSLRKRGSLQKKKQRVLEFRPDAVVVSLERYVTLVWQRQLRRPERQTAYRNICADTQKQRSDI